MSVRHDPSLDDALFYEYEERVMDGVPKSILGLQFALLKFRDTGAPADSQLSIKSSSPNTWEITARWNKNEE